MSVINGNDQANFIDLRGLVPGPNETANGSYAGAGDDTVYGSSYTDVITGGDGNDLIYGFDGDDLLVGNAGNDTLVGGNGNDSLYAGAGNDILGGGAGNDILWGGAGNDQYNHGLNEGVDIINDDKSETGATGFGGGTQDVLYLSGISSSELNYGVSGNDLWFFSASDIADGVVNDGVKIENFFAGGNNVIEYLVTSNGATYDLTSLL